MLAEEQYNSYHTFHQACWEQYRHQSIYILRRPKFLPIGLNHSLCLASILVDPEAYLEVLVLYMSCRPGFAGFACCIDKTFSDFFLDGPQDTDFWVYFLASVSP